MNITKWSKQQYEEKKLKNPVFIEKVSPFLKIDGDSYILDWDVFLKSERENKLNNIQIVKNFSKSMTTWAGNGFQRVQQHVYNTRIAICQKCEFWEEHGNMGMGKCLKCGCGKGKHWLPHEQCPIGLWGKEQ